MNKKTKLWLRKDVVTLNGSTHKHQRIFTLRRLVTSKFQEIQNSVAAITKGQTFVIDNIIKRTHHLTES